MTLADWSGIRGSWYHLRLKLAWWCEPFSARRRRGRPRNGEPGPGSPLLVRQRRLVSLLRSPRDHRPDPLSVAGRGQWPVARLSLPAWRHRDQHPAQDRDDLDADDLRAADLPDARAAGSALASLAVDGQPGHAARPVYAQLAEQRHRRFIKTHTPLDGIPLDPRVTYIVAARHPLDTFVSLRRTTRSSAPRPTSSALRRTGPAPRPTRGPPRAGPAPRRTGTAPGPAGPRAGRARPRRTGTARRRYATSSGRPPPDRPGRRTARAARATGAARLTRGAARRPAQLDRHR